MRQEREGRIRRLMAAVGLTEIFIMGFLAAQYVQMKAIGLPGAGSVSDPGEAWRSAAWFAAFLLAFAFAGLAAASRAFFQTRSKREAKDDYDRGIDCGGEGSRFHHA